MTWGLLMITVLFIETINYVATTPRIVNEPEWIVNIVAKCPHKNLDEAFSTKSMIDAGLVGFGFGSYLGLLFHARMFPGLMLRKATSEKRWYTWPLLRVIFGLIICAPILSLYLLKPEQISNVYVLSLFKTFVPTMASSFIIFGTLDWICIKLKLLTFAPQTDDARIYDPAGQVELTVCP